MRNRIAAVTLLALALSAGLVGAESAGGGWVNFSTGYVNAPSGRKNMHITLEGEGGYQPERIGFVVDDNGGSVNANVSWAGSCYDETRTWTIQVAAANGVGLPFARDWNVPVWADRCSLSVDAVSGESGHIDVVLRQVLP